MSKPKTHDIDSRLNPFDPVMQKNAYDAFENYQIFVSAMNGGHIDGHGLMWDDSTVNAWNEKIPEIEKATKKIEDRINARKCAILSAENVDDLRTICKIVTNGCIKSLLKWTADKYIVALASGKRPHDKEDIESVAFESLVYSLQYMDAIQMGATEKRTCERGNIKGWNHVLNDSDYTEKEKTVYEWMRAGVFAYIESMRGVRVSVPVFELWAILHKPGAGYIYTEEKYKTDTISAVLYKPHAGIVWKTEEYGRMKNTSVYYPLYSINENDSDEIKNDADTSDWLYRMKATPATCGVDDKPVNEYIHNLAKRMHDEKVCTDKQMNVITLRETGDSWRTIAGVIGVTQKMTRDHYHAGWKRVVKWLESLGYETETYTSPKGRQYRRVKPTVKK